MFGWVLFSYVRVFALKQDDYCECKRITMTTELKATFCFIHERFYFNVATMMPRCDWQRNVATRQPGRRRKRGRNRIKIYAVMRKKKNNKPLSSFHASFWRTGCFWAATLLNLICHSIWFKVCLAPLTLLSLTLAPTSIFLGFHPQRVFPFHPSLGLPFSTHTHDDETETLLPFRGPECRWFENKVQQLLCLEAGEQKHLICGTVRAMSLLFFSTCCPLPVTK